MVWICANRPMNVCFHFWTIVWTVLMSLTLWTTLNKAWKIRMILLCWTCWCWHVCVVFHRWFNVSTILQIWLWSVNYSFNFNLICFSPCYNWRRVQTQSNKRATNWMNWSGLALERFYLWRFVFFAFNVWMRKKFLARQRIGSIPQTKQCLRVHQQRPNLAAND